MRVAESMLMQVEQRLQPVTEDLVGIGRVGTLIKDVVGISQVEHWKIAVCSCLTWDCVFTSSV